METVTTSVSPVEVPEVGFRLSQAASSEADQLRVLPPELEIFRDWSGGLGPSCVAEKLKLEGLKAMVGGGGLTVKVTGMD